MLSQFPGGPQSSGHGELGQPHLTVPAAGGDQEVARQDLGLEHVGPVASVELHHTTLSLPVVYNDMKIVRPTGNPVTSSVEAHRVDAAFVTREL